ncbi:beta-ketoacyl-ACP synthase II [Salinicola endophyticus]|uniref:3-oxoacyl-[acyl-carrier-protein] synthase 2 n=1 Tax=Salinicola endophyticus TaxID=1949083 RepID=A0AB74U4E6_9GAMM
MRRIVVTGMGILSPLGCQLETVWQRLLSGASGLRRLPAETVEGLAVGVGGPVPTIEEDSAGFDLDRAIDPKERRKMDRFIQMAVVAADDALRQANWYPQSEDEKTRTATLIGSGIGGFPAIADAVRTTDSRGPRRLSPFTIPSFLANLACGHISIRHGFKGPLAAPVTACAAGLQAIGDAARMIHAGEAEIAVCGGSEACIDRVSLGGFAAAKALSSHYNDTPEAASRPFDQGRDGFVMGEGAGVIVIETLEHAQARGATPIAELVGYGTTSDAYHLTAGPEDGEGAARAMQIALRQAGLAPSDIAHLNAHATSTPVGDRGELAAVKRVFGEHRPAISATKAATGHLLGAAGGVEAIFTLLALRDQIAPVTRNYLDPDPLAAEMDVVHGESRPMAMEHAICNAFGFGGVNASVIFKRFAG